MLRSTIIFLILLRLAIGWHFFFEGLDKLRSMWIGPTETNRPFSSAGYFREAPGPMGDWMRGTLGDPFQEARARLTLRPSSPDARREKPDEYLPQALDQDWNDYFNRFVAFYGLDKKQQELAQTRLKQAKSNLVSVWLDWDDRKMTMNEEEKSRHGIKKVKKNYPSGVVEVEETVPERVAEYFAGLDELRQTQNYKLWYFGKDVEKQRLVKAKGELDQKRADLMKDVDEKTSDMKKSLADVLTPEQKEKGEVPPGPGNWRLQWLDRSTAWGLTILGGCLIAGLLTRISSVLLAAFLVMTYLAVPAFPWLPVPPNTEGNYFYINKNVIEMLALLVLATVPSGRWLGLDALLYWFRGALFGRARTPAVQPADTFPTYRV